MSPLLEAGYNLPTTVKFVRNGGIVAYDENFYHYHAEIAATHNLGEPLPGTPPKRRVDDGGRLKLESGTIHLSGFAGSCQLREDDDTARKETAEVVAQITGKKVVIDEI